MNTRLASPLLLRLLLPACAAVLSSCATLDENSCRTGDWRQLGYVDGLKGYATSRLAEHGKACAQYRIVPDETAWRLGYYEGQTYYCTAVSGYEQGRDGRGYGNVCPADSDRLFRPAYEDGRRVGSLLSQLNSLDSSLRDIANTLADDDRRGRAYLDAIRDGREPAERPLLLDRRDRAQLERDYARYADDYLRVQQALSEADAQYSAIHGATPLQPVLRNY